MTETPHFIEDFQLPCLTRREVKSRARIFETHDSRLTVTMILRLGNHLQMTVFQGFGYFPGQRIFMDLITVIQPDIWI